MGKRRAAVSVIFAACALLGVSWPHPAGASTTEGQLRAEVARFLNYERSNRGLSLLPVDADLESSAQTWSEHNRSTECVSSEECHSPEGSYAEILAWGRTDSRSGGIVEAWMRSAIHRNILLHPSATALGVGFACTDGDWAYVTVHFAGVHQPVPATEEDPKYTRPEQGSACALPAAYASPRAPTTTVTAPPAVPSPVPSTTAPTPATQPAAFAASTPPPPSTATPTTSAIRIGLRTRVAGASVTNLDRVAALEESAVRQATTEPAWVAMIVVVVLLYAVRIAGQLRAGARARRSENGRRRVGL